MSKGIIVLIVLALVVGFVFMQYVGVRIGMGDECVPEDIQTETLHNA